MRLLARPALLAALCALVIAAVAAAAGAPPIIPIAGLAGADVQPLATLRTADGGAVLLARVTDAAGSADGHVIVARLEADGSLDLGYGTAGLVTLPVDPRAVPTALAVQPARGDAWIGVNQGRGLPGQILALDTYGRLVRAFGKAGVLTLAAGAPSALDWAADKVLVADGTSPCPGCRLSVIGAISGRVLRSATLAPAALGAAGCGASVSAAVFVGGDREAVTTDTTRHGCASGLLTLGPGLGPLAGSTATSVPGTDTSIAVSGGGTTWGCFAAAGPGGVRISAYSGSSVSKPASAPAGSLLALAPIAQGACGALIGVRGGTVVAQMASGDARSVADRLPATVAPAAMFRCHQHLLVVGAQGSRTHHYGVVLALAVSRGASSAAVPSTGCH